MSENKRDAPGFEADVSEDVIRAALDSVNRRSSESAAGRAAAAAEAASSVEPRVDIEVETSAPPASVAPADNDDRERKELQAQLDLSVSRARETMDRLKETHERHLRAAADLENYKKRAQREKEEAERFGIQKLLKDLLPVMDNFDRALSHVTEKNPFVEGIQATRRIFEDTLGRYGVKSFSAVGQPFDPTRHEAMQQVPTAEVPPSHVVSEMVRGYTLHDRLVRPALVAVAVPLPVAEGEKTAAVPAKVEEVAGAPTGAPGEKKTGEGT